MTYVPPPMSLLAELTHICPLRCPYCSNPLNLSSRMEELSTNQWKDIISQAAKMGVLQIHFSGGEPMVRADLVDLITHAAQLNLYTNLVTSGIFLTREKLNGMANAGLDHIQLSFQDIEAEEADRLSGIKQTQSRKLQAAQLIKEAGFPLTLNFVIQRNNIERIEGMLALAAQLGARRVEIAHTQYYGWALKNRKALLPNKDQIRQAEKTVEQARELYKSSMVIDHVTPDYYTDIPKPCMGGWGQRFINITPTGRVLPCHAAETIPDVPFPTIKENNLEHIWSKATLFQLFRGTEWMKEPCVSCDRKTIDWGGCRCQALALAFGADRTDPVCHLSRDHDKIIAIRQETDTRTEEPPDFVYRTRSIDDNPA